MIWLKYLTVQFVMFLFWVVGLFVLIPACRTRAWQPSGKSIKDNRPIDQWTWKWLRPIFHNPEDGDSGITALIWVNGRQVPYNPTGSRWLAYKWSAIRNSADGLKYYFANPNGRILAEFTLFGKTHKMGWQKENGYKVPVLS